MAWRRRYLVPCLLLLWVGRPAFIRSWKSGARTPSGAEIDSKSHGKTVKTMEKSMKSDVSHPDSADLNILKCF